MARDLMIGGPGMQEYEYQRRLEVARRLGRDVPLKYLDIFVLLEVGRGIPVRLRDEDENRIATLRKKVGP